MEDTICSISTAVGNGAISIVRMSGKETINIISSIFKGSNLKKAKSHTIHYGYIYDNEELIDEVLVSLMLRPKTYTTEDIVEINSHGGIETTNRILELLIKKGCRLAEPGEFTKRAFLNGRIDLTQAESVNDLINSESDKARKLALNNLGGLLNKKIKIIRDDIMSVISNIEVNIDYPEYEDVKVVTKKDLLPGLEKVKEKLQELYSDAKNGKLIKDGINVAIVGKPNVGKSSLLNAFLDEEKAIVTDIAGTTRDIVEGRITLSGFLINFIDTAGLRETDDVVEKIGVEKSKYTIEFADLVIIVLNNNDELSKYELDLINEIDEEKRIIYVNKNDLDNNLKIEYKYVSGNTISLDGINNLKQEIIDKLNLDKISIKDKTYITNARQKALVSSALEAISSAITALEKNTPIDMVEIDIKRAWNYLGEITGEVYQDELITTLFSNFCLGK